MTLVTHLIPRHAIAEMAQAELRIGLDKLKLRGPEPLLAGLPYRPPKYLLAYFKNAKKGLQTAIKDYYTSGKSERKLTILCQKLILNGLDTVGDGKPDKPLIFGNPEWFRLDPMELPEDSFKFCPQKSNEPIPASMFRDHAIATYWQSRLGGGSEAGKLLDTAQQSATIAALSSDTKISAASNYALLGDTLLHSGHYYEAMQAYGLAWQGGERPRWLPENFDFAANRHEEQGGSTNKLYPPPSIDNIEPLQSVRLEAI